MANGSKPTTFKPLPVLLLLFLSIVILLFVSFISIPRILSTEWGKEKLFAYIKSRYHLDVKCSRLSLTWFEHLEITDLEIVDSKSKTTFTCDIIKTETALYDLIFKKNLGHLYFDRPYLTLHPSLTSLIPSRSPKAVGVQRASFVPFALQNPSGPEPLLHVALPYFGTLECTYGKIELAAAGMDPILFDELSLNVENTRAEHALTAHIACKTVQKGVQGSLHADAAFVNLNTDSPILKAKAEISQLPIEGIDELISLFEPQCRGLLVQTLGETADLTLNAASAAGLEIDLTASSPLLKGQLSMTTEGNKVSLKKPAEFTYTLTPACFEKLAKLDPRMNSLALQSNATLQVILSKFNSEVPHTLHDLLIASFEIQTKALSPLAFTCNGTPISLNPFDLAVTGDQGTMRFKAAAVLTSAQKSGPLNIEGSLNALTHQMSISVSAADFPTIILGEIAKVDKLPVLIGDTLTLTASGEINKNSLLRIEAHTPVLTLQKLVLEADESNSWRLRSPADFQYLLSLETMKLFSPMGILEPAKLQGRINSLVLPLSSLQNTELDLEMSSPRIALASNVSLNNLVAQLSVHTLDKISLSISSDRFQGHLAGKYQFKTGKASLTEPFVCTATLDNPLLHALVQTPASLLKPVDFKVSIDPFSCNLNAFSMDAIAFKGNATANLLSVAPFAGAPEITMQNLSIPFQWNGPQKVANIALSASVQEKEQSLGSLALKSTLSDVQWNAWNKVTALVSLDIQQMPSAFLDSILGKNLFSPLLGAQFSANVKIQSSPSQQTMEINLASPLLNIKSAFATNGTALTLASPPAEIQWTLTPEGYSALDRLMTQQKGKLGFVLKEPSRFQINVSKLELPLVKTNALNSTLDRIPKVSFDLSRMQCIGNGTNPNIAVFDQSSQETIAVSTLAFSFNKSQNAPLTFACDANIATQNSNSVKNLSGKSGTISLKGNIENLFDEKGQMHLDTLSSQVTLQIKNFPSRLLDLAARLKGRTDYPFTKLFGNTIQASFQANVKNLSGPISLNVNAPNMRFALDAVACNTGILLEKPIYAQMKITKEMSTLLLKEANPLSITYFYSEDPVTLEIPAKGFYIPLNPFNLSMLTIPSARIELGKIACRNEGNINIALSLLKSKQFEKNREVLLWFAPIDLHISKGVANIERTEILLAEKYDIALWGKVKLVDKYVDMLLGLPAATLAQAFAIKDLPDDYVLTIPMKGPMDNVKIDSSKATTKIALLHDAVQKFLQNSTGNSPLGGILGGVLKQMATLPDSGKVPPAKHPFPWEKNTSSTEDPEQPYEKKVHFKQNEKPLKQLLKVIR